MAIGENDIGFALPFGRQQGEELALGGSALPVLHGYAGFLLEAVAHRLRKELRSAKHIHDATGLASHDGGHRQHAADCGRALQDCSARDSLDHLHTPVGFHVV